MNMARPLFWHQGIYLQPQHFQLHDRACQGLFEPYRQYLAPDFWGVGSMEILEGALAAGTFTLQRGDFLFGDGTHVSLPGNALIDARPFDQSWVKDGKPFTVYLGLRNWTDEGENVTVLPTLQSVEDIQTRFFASPDSETTGDLHEGGPKANVRRLFFALKLFWETETDKLGDYQLIPLAQLEKFGSEIRLSGDFIPPCIALSACASLQKLGEEIRDQVTARAYQLEEHKSRRGVQTAEFGSRDMVYFLALRSINRYVPLLFHYTTAERTHPWRLYGILRQLAGELTTFSEKVSVLGELQNGDVKIPEYNHRELWQCFSSAQDMITHLLDEITAGPEYVIRLVKDGLFFAAELKPAVFEGRNRYYLVVRTESDPKEVLAALGKLAKLSSREYLQLLVTQALSGIGLEHLPVPPQELPRRAHTVCFRIDHHHDQWAKVAKTRTIALFWHGAPEDAEVELMVVGR